MDHRELHKLYPKGYKREHSYYLNQLFDINRNGVDYHTPNNIAVEFKETFARKDNSLWFKIPKKQMDHTDIFVFCVKKEQYFIVDKEDIAGAYSFNTYKERANIRLGKVKSMALQEFTDVYELKNFLDQLEM